MTKHGKFFICKKCSGIKLPEHQKIQIYKHNCMISSSIQTILSAPESHRIGHKRLAGFTAGGDLHPALKILFNS